MTPRLIDIHCHFVPSEFPGAPNEAAASRWPCLCHNANGKAMLKMGDKPFRKLDPRSWDKNRRIDDMDAEGVAIQVLSPMPELLSYWHETAAATELARHVNGALAAVVAECPTRFWALGMVTAQDIRAAVASLPQLKADGFRGIELGSNINGRYLGEPEFEPLFAAAADLGLAIFVHALHPLQASYLKSFPDLIPFAAFMSDTGLCAASIVMSGIFERYPSLRIGLSHGGGVFEPILHRLDYGWASTDGFEGKLSIRPKEIGRRFFVDSLVYSADYARYLVDAAPGHVCLGTDYPYMIEQREPRRFISEIARSEVDTIWNQAAENFLGLS